MEEKQRCEERVWGSGSYKSHQCYRDAKVERDGKHYCTIHDPVRIEEKRKAKEDKWNKEFSERREKQEYKNSAAAYCKKKGLTFEQLNDALMEDSE